MNQDIQKLKLELHNKDLLSKYEYNSNVIITNLCGTKEFTFELFLYLCRYCNPSEHPISLISLIGCYHPNGQYRKNGEYDKNLIQLLFGNHIRHFRWFNQLIELYTDQDLYNYYLIYNNVWCDTYKVYRMFNRYMLCVDIDKVYINIIKNKCYKHFKFLITNKDIVKCISC